MTPGCAELLSRGELTDPALHAEALALLRAHPAMEMARADLRRWAATARQEILALPDVPGPGRVRGALRLRGRAHRLTRAAAGLRRRERKTPGG